MCSSTTRKSMFSFEENAVWIPVEVLEELDRFKSESTTRGANAREVHRRLSERFSHHRADAAGGSRWRITGGCTFASIRR